MEGVLKEWQRRALVALTRDLGSVSSTPMVAHTCLFNRALTSMDTVVAHTRMRAKHARIIKMLKKEREIPTSPLSLGQIKSLGSFQVPTQQMVLGMDSGMSQGY